MRLLLILAVSVCSAIAQEFVAPEADERDLVPIEPVDPRPSIEGIVKEVFVTQKPWQLVNPLAPKEYGTGEKMVSQDFGPATPFKSTGWVIFGIEW
jgi:hypothetical protein